MSTVHYLLDTNIVSYIVRQPHCALAMRIASLEPHSYAISVVVAAELQYGAQRLGSKRLTDQLEAVLSAIKVLPLEPPADRHYGTIRAELDRSGQPIGQNDLLIAAHARTLGATLVTNNPREFARVPGLNVENWRQA